MKSIDVKWDYKFKEEIITFYATLKYTNEAGGAQDNQLEDVFKFHQLAKDCKDKNIYLFSITDGDYYNTYYTKHKEIKNLSKINYMNNQFSGIRNKATDSNHLLYDMLIVIKDWLISSFEEDEFRQNEIKKINIILNKYDKLNILK